MATCIVDKAVALVLLMAPGQVHICEEQLRNPQSLPSREGAAAGRVYHMGAVVAPDAVNHSSLRGIYGS